MKDYKFDKYSLAVSQPQSNYALTHFVDGAQLTNERRFRQVVIELDVAYEAEAALNDEIAILTLKLRKKRGKRDDPGMDKHDRGILEIKISQMERKIAKARIAVEGRRREIRKHQELLSVCEELLGITEGMSEQEIYNMLQAAEGEYYVRKLALDSAATMVSRSGGPNAGVLSALQQMPEKDMERIAPMIEAIANVMSQGKASTELDNHRLPAKLQYKED